LRIDSHVCFSENHPPEHLQAILARNKFDGALLVVDGPNLPATEPHIAGLIVRDLTPLDEYRLDEYRQAARFRGICSSLAQVDPETAGELARRGIPLDIEMRPADFPALLDLAHRHPDLRIAIDHLARPAYHRGLTDEWLDGMESASRLPNVFCKISGLLTEVEQLPWNAAPIRPFVQYALAVFGPRRLMFGSEWPVRLPDITWKESLAAFTQCIGANPIEVREQLLGGTAASFYSLDSVVS
jgi:predicted TIM-barrel fold metal-dependent hydrolase